MQWGFKLDRQRVKTEFHDKAVHLMDVLKIFLLPCNHIAIYSYRYSTAHYL